MRESAPSVWSRDMAAVVRVGPSYWCAPGCAPGGRAVAYGVCRQGGIASERLVARLSVTGRAVQYWSIAGERPVKARLSVTGRACVRGSCVRAW